MYLPMATRMCVKLSNDDTSEDDNELISTVDNSSCDELTMLSL